MLYLLLIDSEEGKRKFVIIHEKYRALMLKVAFDVLEDTHEAEDAVQEAFIKVARNMKCIGEVDSDRTKRFLITVAKNAARDMLRKKRSRGRYETYVDEMEDIKAPVVYQETDIDCACLDVLKNLSPKYRDVFILKYAYRYDNKDIARIMGITEGTVRQRISRGKIKIQEALDALEEAKK